MRELGWRSGEARRTPNPERVDPGLREYLRAEVHPERVWAALEMAMTGANESARVSASKVLLDALAEPAGGCPECEARKVEAPHIEAKLLALLGRHEPERTRDLRAVVHKELAAIAEHVGVSQVEDRLVARL
jgi:hypothetical protein